VGATAPARSFAPRFSALRSGIRKELTMSQTNLLTSWEEKEETLEGGFRVTRISFGGDRHVMAILGAVIEQYNFLAQRERPSEEDLYSMVGSRVTLIRTGENMLGGGLLVAQEGKLFAGASGLGILPKGARKNGWRVKPHTVLDVLPGYDTDGAVELAGRVREHFPKLKPFDRTRLEELPSNSETLSLCLFGTYQMPDSAQVDALYLASEYDRVDDIVEGVVLLRPQNGVSEHGSRYGDQLLHHDVLGEVVGFEPISFAEGIHLCNLDFEEAYEQVIGKKVAA
jgi:hypothetical protein